MRLIFRRLSIGAADYFLPIDEGQSGDRADDPAMRDRLRKIEDINGVPGNSGRSAGFYDA